MDVKANDAAKATKATKATKAAEVLSFMEFGVTADTVASLSLGAFK
ncbi:MAG: hypothetical protein JKY40_00205 [Gammaproteobacteria bacterium]|nr:hypothetical protein [Gammaproteobacteria bacterium]MBL4727790.1 hypothetical protein [Gammaproteobacteria bacterium]